MHIQQFDKTVSDTESTDEGCCAFVSIVGSGRRVDPHLIQDWYTGEAITCKVTLHLSVRDISEMNGESTFST